jgi:hypothetical protein
MGDGSATAVQRRTVAQGPSSRDPRLAHLVRLGLRDNRGLPEAQSATVELARAGCLFVD